MKLHDAWQVLGIVPASETGMVRKAYAERLRAMDPDADVAGFAELRAARDFALDWIRREAERAARGEAADSDDDELQVWDDETWADDNFERFEGFVVNLDGGADQPFQPPQPVWFLDPTHPAEPSELSQPPETAPRRARAYQARRFEWPYAAPFLAGHDPAPSGPTVAALTPGQSEPFAYAWLTAGSGAQRDLPLPADWAFGSPQLAPELAPAEACVVIGRRYDRRLSALLFPADEALAEASLTPAEEISAQAALRMLLRDAQTGSLEQFDEIGRWLAQSFAGAWPRSAPLIELADQTFGWSREAGRLGERHELAFLNERLAGMRFHRAVLAPGHRYHRAWRELERRGAAGLGKSLRVRTATVQQLIRDVRHNYPELESFWNLQRVGSWEPLSSAPQRSRGPSWWVYLWIGLGIIRLIVSAGGGEQSATEPPAFANFDAVNAAVTEAFGPGKTIVWLRQVQPEFAQTVESNVAVSRAASAADRGTAPGLFDNRPINDKIVELVRERTVAAGLRAGGSDLDKTMRLRLGLARSAKGGDACLTYISTGRFSSPVDVPEKLRREERNYAAALAEIGQLSPPTGHPAGTASVPGALIERVMNSTGLSQKAVAAALRRQGSTANQCKVWTALLAATLDYKGSERSAVLAAL